MTILFNTLLLSLIILSVFIVFTHKLRVAIILSGLCSMLAAFVYLFLAAPDVAIAEAIIGSTLSTIIFLIGIRKYRVCTVCALPSDNRMETKLWSIIDRCATKKELEPTVLHVHNLDELKTHFYDLAYELTDKNITLYGEIDNYFISDVYSSLLKEFPEIPIKIMQPSAEKI